MTMAEIVRALKRSGWSVGDVASDAPRGRVWIVSGTNGENRIVAEGKAELQAWHKATEQARAVGMLRLNRDDLAGDRGNNQEGR